MTPEDIAQLRISLPTLSDREVVRGMETAPLESEEFDMFADEAERRNLDS